MGARRVLVALVGAAVVLAGCRVPGEWFPGHGKAEPSGVHVVAPANKTQAPASGEVPLDVRVASNLDPATLRVWIVAGWSDPTSTTEISGRLAHDATGATATIHAADLQPGLTTIKARAARKNGHGNETGYASFSWEPTVDTATADRCDPIATREVPDAVPERLLHRRRPDERHRSPGALRRAVDAVERRPACRSTPPSGTATTASAPAP